MTKDLYATISVAKRNEKKDVKIYKIEDEKYGIEIISKEKGAEKISKVENLTKDENKIERVLETLVLSAQNFTLLEDFAYDFRD